MRTAALSGLYEHAGPFASVTLDVSRHTETDAEELRLRARAVRRSLMDQGADEPLVDAVCRQVSAQVFEPAPVARVVVANASGVVFDETMPAPANHPVATWSPLPDVDSWVAHEDARIRYVLALVDHVGGDVGVYWSDVPEPDQGRTVGGETHYVHKVRTGGWSNLRYQHVTENIWRRNADEVAEEIASHLRAGLQLVLLGGDPYSCSAVAGGLARQPVELVHLDHAGRADDRGQESLWAAVHAALSEHAQARRQGLLQELAERTGREDVVATGVRAVADALGRGQVEDLVLDPQALSALTVTPRDHPGLDLGRTGATGSATPIRADLALVAGATCTGSQIRVARRDELGVAVAALLRWN